MNKQQAQKIIQETFESPFDKVRFNGFVKNLLNHIEEAPFIYQGSYIPEAYRQYVKSLERVGKYRDGENALDILIITLQKDTSLERARTMQRNFMAWYLNGSRGGIMKDGALAAYVSPNHDDWRFSLVRMDYKFEKTDTGRMKVKEEFTPARRWSFLVGSNEKSHTAQSRLVKILADDEHDPTLEEMEEVFNIETVTKEFFLKYRELFIRTREALEKIVNDYPNVKADFDAKGVDTVNFAKKLLGQIVFLYFLQKKGWFGVGRDDDWGSGSKQFLRELFTGTHGVYQNFFNDILEPLFYEALRINRSHDDDYYSRFNCKIPFLNGGLFDPIGNYDWVHTDIHLPNEIFSNTRKTKEGDSGDGILDVFDRYNFTVREDEPLEKEVAIDPELLGKAYEKFNAIRPDNFDEFTKALKSGKKGDESKFNKKFGVYYTPREIVHYMCKQSLINYLATHAEEVKLDIPISKQDIEDLIEVGELITEHEATALIKEKSIKDGTLKSTEYISLLSEGIRKNAKIIDDWLEDITVCDPAVGSGAFPVGMMAEIVRVRSVLSVFLPENGRSDYEFKRRCIEHSLYGVDIDPGAVEIAKLRLWLSLVVDEEDIKNIKPLPNLDYKIVCGNSLLGVEKDLFNQQQFEELEELKPLFFGETNPTKKQEYKHHIDELIYQITNGHTEFDFEVYFSEVFHEKGGFDVVIANPPYGFRNVLTAKEKQYFRKDKGVQFPSGDIAELFTIIMNENLVREEGTQTFIIPKKSLYGESWKNVRVLWTSKKLLCLMDASKAFEDVLLEQVVFSLAKKNNKSDKVNIGALDQKSNRIKNFGDFELEKISTDDLRNIQIYKGLYPDGLIQKIKTNSVENTNSIINAKIGISNITKHLSLKPHSEYYCVKGIDIIRYGLKRERYLKKEVAEKYYKTYNEKKIIAQEIIAHIENPFPHIVITMFYDDVGRLLNDTCVEIRIVDSNIEKKFVLGLLQSVFLNWYAYNFIYNRAIRTMHFINYYVSQIPFPKKALNEKDTQKPIINLVDQILSITKSDDYLQNPQKQAIVKELEREIDHLVYQLYGLTDEEIRIVECEK